MGWEIFFARKENFSAKSQNQIIDNPRCYKEVIDSISVHVVLRSFQKLV